MKLILETERTYIKEFCLDDAQFIIELLNSEGWLTYIGDRNVRTEEAAKDYLQSIHLNRYEKDGFSFYKVELKEGIPIGMCGLIRREGFEDIDIGFAFLPLYNGKGYAFETAKPLLDFGFNELKMPRIAAYAMPNNQNSIRLIEKLGLVYERNIRFPNQEEELLMFAKSAT